MTEENSEEKKHSYTPKSVISWNVSMSSHNGAVHEDSFTLGEMGMRQIDLDKLDHEEAGAMIRDLVQEEMANVVEWGWHSDDS